MVSSTCDSDSRGSNRVSRSTSAADLIGLRNRRSFALDEIEVEAQRPEGEQQIGEENRRVDVEHVERLQRDGDRERRIPAEIQERVLLAQRAILRQIPAGLTHEPDGSGVHRFEPARPEETIVHPTRPSFARASAGPRGTSA